MQFILPFCNKDAWLAEKLCAWIGELGGLDKKHSCLLLCAKATLPDQRMRVLSEARKSLGCQVEMLETITSNELGWPEACNHLFYCAAARMRSVRKPFFWLEPDCVPLRKTWLDELAKEYQECGKQFMGAIYEKPWKHLTGCAIYPGDVHRFNPDSLHPRRNQSGPLPWDTVNPAATLKYAHETKLICHRWGENDQAPSFATVKDLDSIPKDAALFHRCKDFSLVERIRDSKRPVIKTLINIASEAISSTVKKLQKKPKIDLLYICVRSASEPNVPRNFRESHERFVKTYKQFKPEIDHRLIVVCYNGERDAETEELFGELNPTWAYYVGTGFDIGTYLDVGRTLDSDFVLCCGSNVHFHRSGWLERIIEAWQKHGEGVYGPMASYENGQHIRTCCVGTSPKLLRRYPYKINSRLESYNFENGEWCFSRWAIAQGLPALMVMWDGELTQQDWRKPPNIFRRGDQSNCIIWDRHTKVYADADDNTKRDLARWADGNQLTGPLILPYKRFPHKTLTVVAVTSLNGIGHAKAIEKTAALIPIPCEKLLICSETVPGFSGKQIPLPEPWAKDGKWELDDMADFLTHGLHEYITTDACITVHDDGYALNSNRWNPNFLLYDYIGAPWAMRFEWVKPGCRVGNGGFSLRSKKWLVRANELHRRPRGLGEDTYSNVYNITHFLHAGCTIAPLKLAMQWSFEHTIEEFPKWTLRDSFGFHGLTNRPSRSHLRLNNSSL